MGDVENIQYEFSDADVHYMTLALNLAQQGAEKGEVPVGAVLVQTIEQGVKYEQSSDNKGLASSLKTSQQTQSIILGQGYNQPILAHDPTAHAEIIALREACQHLQNYRLPVNTTLYVTLEPCTMCVGALIHARLSRLVFATAEPRAGMVGSQGNLLEADFYNHKKILVQSGLMATESGAMLKAFFRERRDKKKKHRWEKRKDLSCN